MKNVKDLGDIKPAGAYKLVAFMVGKILERGGRSRLIVKAKGTDSLTEMTAIKDQSYRQSIGRDSITPKSAFKGGDTNGIKNYSYSMKYETFLLINCVNKLFKDISL